MRSEAAQDFETVMQRMIFSPPTSPSRACMGWRLGRFSPLAKMERTDNDLQQGPGKVGIKEDAPHQHPYRGLPEHHVCRPYGIVLLHDHETIFVQYGTYDGSPTTYQSYSSNDKCRVHTQEAAPRRDETVAPDFGCAATGQLIFPGKGRRRTLHHILSSQSRSLNEP